MSKQTPMMQLRDAILEKKEAIKNIPEEDVFFRGIRNGLNHALFFIESKYLPIEQQEFENIFDDGVEEGFEPIDYTMRMNGRDYYNQTYK